VLMLQAGIVSVGSDPHHPGSSLALYYIVAFVIGYRAQTFRELIKRLFRVVREVLAGLQPGSIPGGRAADRGDKTRKGVHRQPRRERVCLVDDDGIGHAAPKPPPNVTQFVDEQAEGFVLHQAADIQTPDWWKIEFHHLPHEHVTATWDGGYAVVPHVW
jgi:hypothetical protein